MVGPLRAAPVERMRRFFIGTQGWNYDFWVGRFYPAGTRAGDMLELYSRVFRCVEVDSTFYAMPPAARFRSWYDRTPADFTFALKLPRDITHDARLERAGDVLLEFCDRAMLLREKLGPLLIQLPADFTVRHREAAERFLLDLPPGPRFAIEFRDAAWFDERTFDVLRATGTTLAVSVGPWLDSGAALEVARTAPGSFRYLRWMGSPRKQDLTAGMLRERGAELEAWGRVLREADDGADVYAFFNNDYLGHSPDTARRLQALVGADVADPDVLREQGELF